MCFQTAITELKANGKGTTEHQPIVSEEDRKKIFTLQSILVQIRRFGLYNKVQWDTRLYFSRRGAENMRSITKNTFVVKIDPETNRKYVTKH